MVVVWVAVQCYCCRVDHIWSDWVGFALVVLFALYRQRQEDNPDWPCGGRWLCYCCLCASLFAHEWWGAAASQSRDMCVLRQIASSSSSPAASQCTIHRHESRTMCSCVGHPWIDSVPCPPAAVPPFQPLLTRFASPSCCCGTGWCTGLTAAWMPANFELQAQAGRLLWQCECVSLIVRATTVCIGHK